MLYYLSLKAAPMPRRVILEPLIDTFLQNQSAFYNILALQTLSLHNITITTVLCVSDRASKEVPHEGL